MSQRESKNKSIVLTKIGGINERVNKTELKQYEYSSIQGVFPEFAGLQSRLWGKRLLAKYDSAIYGIYQFWSPYGYGSGLYQFDGSLSIGPWFVPTSNFDALGLIDPLDLAGYTIPPGDGPPLLQIDIGGYTSTLFGVINGTSGPFGGGGITSFFGYSSLNTNLFEFTLDGMFYTLSPFASLGGGISQAGEGYSGIEVQQANTPDDTNGGPAGQGKSCRVENTHSDFNLIDYTLNQSTANLSHLTNISDTDNCRNPADGQNPPCVAFPTLPVPIQAAPSIGAFSPITPNGSLSASTHLQTAAIFTQPSNLTCTFRTTCNQTSILADTKMILNFAGLQIKDVFQITLLATRTPGGSIEIPISIGYDPSTGNFSDVTLTASDHLLLGNQASNVDQGFTQDGSVTASQIRVYYRKRNCN